MSAIQTALSELNRQEAERKASLPSKFVSVKAGTPFAGRFNPDAVKTVSMASKFKQGQNQTKVQFDVIPDGETDVKTLTLSPKWAKALIAIMAEGVTHIKIVRTGESAQDTVYSFIPLV